MRTRSRPVAVAAVLAFYAGLGVVAVDRAFDGSSGLADAVVAAGPGPGMTGTGAGPGDGAPGVPTAAAPAVGVGSGGVGGGDNAPGAGATPAGAAGAVDAGGGRPGGATPGAAVPAEPIRVGLRIGNQASTAAMATALGTRGVSGGDQRAYAEALVAHLNATGGIAGRQVVPHYVEVDVGGLVANSDASDQQNCEQFTDAGVFIVLSPFPVGAVLGPCLASRGIPLVEASPEEFNDHDLAELGGMMALPSTPTLHRQGRIVVDALASQGYYEDATVGLVWYDRPTFREAVDESFRPALRAHGVEPVEFVMSSYTSSEQYASAVLRFKAEGVDHVQFVDVSGLVALQFMQYAETQQFRPRYGLSSANSLSAIQTAVSPAQLRGAIGVGWTPSLDTTEERPLSATAQGCADVLRAAGARTGDRVAEAIALWTCEVLSFFRAAMARAPDHSVAGYVAGVGALGDTYVPADTFATRFAPGRYDGPSAVRPLAFDDACPCFRYTGDAYDVG